MSSSGSDNQDFELAQLDTEKRIERANMLYHRCLGTVLERWMSNDKGFEDVSKHCVDQKKRVDTLFQEYKSNYILK